MTVAGYTLTYRGVESTADAERDRDARRARRRAAAANGTLSTGDNQLLSTRRAVARGRDPHELAARGGPLRDRRPVEPGDGVVYVKVLVKPLVNLIWIAGIVFLLGSLVALWPDAREQRRLVARLALARA